MNTWLDRTARQRHPQPVLCGDAERRRERGRRAIYAETNNITLNGQGATLFFNSNAVAKPCNGSCQLAAVITANGANLSPQPTGLHIQNFNIVGVDVAGQPGRALGPTSTQVFLSRA